MGGRNVTVNGRSYAWPERPVVVVCIDGSEPGYIEAAVATGNAPFFERIMADGTNRLADCVVPSFTNPNNMSIVTGRPPSVHGIGANFFYDADSGEDVMTNTPKFLRADTIFKAFFDEGASIAIVTAKLRLTYNGPVAVADPAGSAAALPVEGRSQNLYCNPLLSWAARRAARCRGRGWRWLVSLGLLVLLLLPAGF